MPAYGIEFTNYITYFVEVEAESEEAAYQLTKDWDKDSFAESDIINNGWDFDIVISNEEGWER